MADHRWYRPAGHWCAGQQWAAVVVRLPGDIRIEGENVRFYFPIVTMVVISVVLSLIVYFIARFWK
jgi:hypothetical protein